MNIYPAIDLYEGTAVRLFKGNYDKMTLYDKNPLHTALKFQSQGSSFLHLVDLEGAKNGVPANLDTIKEIVEKTNLFIQLGGGIRCMKTAETYLSMGVDRVILGTAAITEKGFLKEAVKNYGAQIAVGVDIKDRKVAIKGWTELSPYSCEDFCRQMQAMGVQTIICTDVSKDGAMRGTNRELYRQLSHICSIDIIASGGVSTLEDIRALSDMQLHGAILGKALYTEALYLPEAIEAAKGKELLK
ncbi:1-(5-phosphoribosyl)-5-[(5-phosphoribosylamino)methylideneamino]imidazole-4-carboxamide isomerase [Aminipila luticellarii]|uniref:1-(5-phosphoribosyl)-5-[(5-phosphoribosylamino)methylideneamino] imidazole-4-carboxamide isomerase n=1 Tax=Aminipila luticellarii TaxID=2507160 RepID=A0A410PWE3_9FIRM|nr:1-(5-phosphoribosyl)-5-[(5-phosphoribosylamino)methylideneamino]imidazole-4-carboxamide isomerase [Aminipila luticellarii]QAT43237.1 1-(5-phosphoribosyl)-5-[(5-phosphoribosylamino)methylideneamino]imidazole-4-carboxamide isomerase [Aminipila luticellarii]